METKCSLKNSRLSLRHVLQPMVLVAVSFPLLSSICKKKPSIEACICCCNFNRLRFKNLSVFHGFAFLCLVHTKLVCNTSLHVPTQITERVKTGSFDQIFCIIRYQYVSKQFSIRRSRLYSVFIPFLSSSDRVNSPVHLVGTTFPKVQVRLQCVGTRSDPVVLRSHYVQFRSN